jgi:hypothetical protein
MSGGILTRIVRIINFGGESSTESSVRPIPASPKLALRGFRSKCLKLEPEALFGAESILRARSGAGKIVQAITGDPKRLSGPKSDRSHNRATAMHAASVAGRVSAQQGTVRYRSLLMESSHGDDSSSARVSLNVVYRRRLADIGVIIMGNRRRCSLPPSGASLRCGRISSRRPESASFSDSACPLGGN